MEKLEKKLYVPNAEESGHHGGGGNHEEDAANEDKHTLGEALFAGRDFLIQYQGAVTGQEGGNGKADLRDIAHHQKDIDGHLMKGLGRLAVVHAAATG